MTDTLPLRKPGLIHGTAAALLWTFMTLAALWLGGWVVFVIYVWSLKPAGVTVKTDAIIVLTGGANRINTGLDLLHAGAAPRLFISGVDNRVTQEKLISLWNHRDGNAEVCCITLGHEAQNTMENAAETALWVDKSRVSSLRLVTSADHMPRALVEFHHAMPGMDIILHPVAAEGREPQFGIFAFREYNKTLLAALRLYLTRTDP